MAGCAGFVDWSISKFASPVARLRLKLRDFTKPISAVDLDGFIQIDLGVPNFKKDKYSMLQF